MAAIRKKELKEQQPQKKFALHQKYMQKLKKEAGGTYLANGNNQTAIIKRYT